MSGKIEPGERQEDVSSAKCAKKVGIGVLPVRKVSECPSSDGVYWLHWWKVELADENAVLILDPREVSEARWIRPVELRTLDDVFEADVRFFEEIYSALG